MSGVATRVGPYTIEREIGRGGMGVVHLATDSRLGRKVAIKALPEHLAADPDRLARFEREARTLASLNHANVGAIYGVEEVGAQRFLILEYVEGETLQDRLKRGPLPVDESVEVMVGVAAGLEAAHDAGIVHRDLKPGNIKITPEGKVKVLDFGLAKSSEGAASSSGVALTNSPTISSPVEHSPTIPGAIMGTAPYMSPEQARGRAVDRRSDVWSFGVVLYECLTGISPFQGETATDSFGAILHRDADLSLLPPETPPMVRHVLRRCLERDRNERFRDIGDVRIELERGGESSIDASVGAPGRRMGSARLALWTTAALTVGAGATLVAVRPLARPSAGEVVIASIDPAPGTTVITVGDVSGPAVISPDGRLVAFSARVGAGEQTLWLRPIDRAEPESLRGTESAMFPFWSPDSRSIGFFADGRLRRIDLSTRAARTLCDAPGGRGGAWLEGGVIVFSPGFQTPLHRVDAGGGASTPLTTLDPARSTSHRWPSPVRGTDRFVYLAVSHEPAQREGIGVFLGSLGGGPERELIRTGFGAQVVGDRLLFQLEHMLVAAEIDVAAGALTGEPIPVLEGVSGDPSTWHAGFSASDTGALVFHPTAPATSDADGSRVAPEPGLGESVRATIVERDGRPALVVADGMLQNTLATSPDGLSLAISGRWPNDAGEASYDIWVYELFGPETDWATRTWEPISRDVRPRRFTFMAGDEVSPKWSPDGRHIAFGKVFGSAPLGLFVKPLDGGAERLALRVEPDELPVFPTGWSPDGRHIVCRRGPFIGGASEGSLVAVPFGGGEPIGLLTGEADAGAGCVSNDNKWLAYDSGHGGAPEVYVTAFAPGWEAERAAGRPVPEEGQRWRISIAGGFGPVWGRNGDMLYYASSSNSVIGVGWKTDGTRFVCDAGQPLFDFPGEAGAVFDVLPSDQYFVVNTTLAARDTEIRLVLNWPALLGK